MIKHLTPRSKIEIIIFKIKDFLRNPFNIHIRVWKHNQVWSSISIYTKHKETIIRYWGKLKFDWFVISNP
jgi:hypothetical protein